MTTEDSWMQSEAAVARTERARRTPAFHRVWEAAINTRHERQCATSPLAVWCAVAASVILLASIASLFWTVSTSRPSPSQRERDFAAVEGALLTYWQAPSDGWLEDISEEPSSER